MRLLTILLFVSILHAESAAGLHWTPPAGWKSTGTTDMRAATYPVAAAAGDTEGAECVVFFFGKGQGGTVEANMERWKNQFAGPDGKPPAAKVSKRTVNGLPVTLIDATGAYSGMGGPMVKQGAVKQGYRLLGAVVEGPGGNIFLKFTGPGKTVAANQGKFDQMLASFSK